MFLVSLIILIDPNPIGKLILDLSCKKCGNTLSYVNFTDGIMEAIGKEPICFICHINPRLPKDHPNRGCGSSYLSSEIFERDY